VLGAAGTVAATAVPETDEAHLFRAASQLGVEQRDGAFDLLRFDGKFLGDALGDG